MTLEEQKRKELAKDLGFSPLFATRETPQVAYTEFVDNAIIVPGTNMVALLHIYHNSLIKHIMDNYDLVERTDNEHG